MRDFNEWKPPEWLSTFSNRNIHQELIQRFGTEVLADYVREWVDERHRQLAVRDGQRKLRSQAIVEQSNPLDPFAIDTCSPLDSILPFGPEPYIVAQSCDPPCEVVVAKPVEEVQQGELLDVAFSPDTDSLFNRVVLFAHHLADDAAARSQSLTPVANSATRRQEFDTRLHSTSPHTVRPKFESVVVDQSAELPPARPQQLDGWVWAAERTGSGLVFAWIPDSVDKLLDFDEPDRPLPIPRREMAIGEKIVVLCAIHHECWRGETVEPWSFNGSETPSLRTATRAIPYHGLCSRVHDLTQDQLPFLLQMLKDAKSALEADEYRRKHFEQLEAREDLDQSSSLEWCAGQFNDQCHGVSVALQGFENRFEPLRASLESAAVSCHPQSPAALGTSNVSAMPILVEKMKDVMFRFVWAIHDAQRAEKNDTQRASSQSLLEVAQAVAELDRDEINCLHGPAIREILVAQERSPEGTHSLYHALRETWDRLISLSLGLRELAESLIREFSLQSDGEGDGCEEREEAGLETETSSTSHGDVGGVDPSGVSESVADSTEDMETQSAIDWNAVPGTPPIPWTQYRRPSDWAPSLGLTNAKAFSRHCADGKIVHQKLDDKNIRIDIRHLPYEQREVMKLARTGNN